MPADGSNPHRRIPGEPRCEFERTLRGEYCAERGDVGLDGLRLCDRHAGQLRLEERADYWRAMLAHVDLWSEEARTRGRDDVVRLLGREQARSAAALERVLEDLVEVWEGDGQDGSGSGRGPPYGNPSS